MSADGPLSGRLPSSLAIAFISPLTTALTSLTTSTSLTLLSPHQPSLFTAVPSTHVHIHAQITGGRNGYGAKLANIFSTQFTVETCDGRRQRRFLQTFTNNMSSKTQPKITACKPSDNWTCITFQPDLAKFDMQVGVWGIRGCERKGCCAYCDWWLQGNAAGRRGGGCLDC